MPRTFLSFPFVLIDLTQIDLPLLSKKELIRETQFISFLFGKVVKSNVWPFLSVSEDLIKAVK